MVYPLVGGAGEGLGGVVGKATGLAGAQAAGWKGSGAGEGSGKPVGLAGLGWHGGKGGGKGGRAGRGLCGSAGKASLGKCHP